MTCCKKVCPKSSLLQAEEPTWIDSCPFMSFLCWVPRAGCIMAGEVLLESRGRVVSLILLALLLFRSGYNWLSGLQAHIASSGLAFNLLVSSSPSSQSFFCSQSVHSLSLCWLHLDSWGSCGPDLEPFQVPLDGSPLFRCVNHTTQLDAFYRLAGNAFDNFVIDEDVKQYLSHHKLLRDTTCHQCPSGYWAMNRYRLHVTNQIIFSQKMPPSNPYFSNLERRVLLGPCQRFSEVQRASIALLLSTNAVTLPQKTTRR